jgi:glutamyl-tRNA reductase
MRFLLTGISYHTAPVEVRERLAFADEEIPEALTRLVDGAVVGEAMIVSTCNRVEIVATASSLDDALQRLRCFLGEWRSIEVTRLEPHLYTRTDREAVHHLFRVASSLDSMVLGEPQILGQIRDAYRLGLDAGTIGHGLDPLLQRAFAVAKRVRTETAVGASAVSISYAAVELGRKIFDSLRGKSVLLIGAGEMAELAARHLAEAGAGRMMVANRTEERAEQLAEQFGADVVALARLDEAIVAADICLVSTAAPDYLLTRESVRRALVKRKNRPTFIIDISVPRQVDPRVGELDNAYLFDIDDLQNVVDSNLRRREREASVAEQIVAEEVTQYFIGLGARQIGPTVTELKEHLNELAAAEYRRHRRRLGELTAEQEQAIVSVLLPSIVNKISHPMITHLRDSVRDSQTPHEHISIWRRIFHLGGEGD